jgi:hypothetical protein
MARRWDQAGFVQSGVQSGDFQTDSQGHVSELDPVPSHNGVARLFPGWEHVGLFALSIRYVAGGAVLVAAEDAQDQCLERIVETDAVTLGTGNDTVTFTGGSNTVSATIGAGATLNSGDSLTGGSGTDTLVVSGSGTLDLNNLATQIRGNHP